MFDSLAQDPVETASLTIQMITTSVIKCEDGETPEDTIETFLSSLEEEYGGNPPECLSSEERARWWETQSRMQEFIARVRQDMLSSRLF